MRRFAYDKWLNDATLNVVKKIIKEIEFGGLEGEHHVYVTLVTSAPNLKIPDFLKEEYPEEVTLVLQYEFENLKTDPNGFAVSLVFDEELHDLYIPWNSVISVFDPSEQFGLQLQPFLSEYGDSWSEEIERDEKIMSFKPKK